MDDAKISEIVEMAWCDFTSFDAIDSCELSWSRFFVFFKSSFSSDYLDIIAQYQRAYSINFLRGTETLVSSK